MVASVQAFDRATQTTEERLMNITGLLHININCRNFKRSKQFYEMLGFAVIMPVTPEGEGDVAAAVGMQRYLVEGALMKHPSRIVIDLLEWKDPKETGIPYVSMAHPGIARVAFTTNALDEDMATLAKAGVEFLSEGPAEVEGPKGSQVRFICFKDPDGTVLELVEVS
jgi:catechol 2,3-dioxygenase-like lactoylglutathione lyase family enzyme